MSHNKKITLLAALAMICIGFFLFYGLGNWEYSLPRRCFKVLAMMLTGGAIAFSTVIFQTITNNRILTPGIFRPRFPVYAHSDRHRVPVRFNEYRHDEQKS